MEATDKLLLAVEEFKARLDDDMIRKDLDKLASGSDTRGAKAAAFRARKFSMHLEKLMKNFRRASIDVYKK